jgi:hypothetical protein
MAIGVELMRHGAGWLRAFTARAVTTKMGGPENRPAPVFQAVSTRPLLVTDHAKRQCRRDLYAPHIDHRIVVPRLFILANAILSGGNLSKATRARIWKRDLLHAFPE